MANNAAIKSNDIFAIFCAGSVAMKKVITEDLEGETGLQTLKNRSTRMPETWRCNLERAEKIFFLVNVVVHGIATTNFRRIC
jgi:hypothetical protein